MPDGTPAEGRITTDRERDIFLIDFDRPKKLNGFSLKMYRELVAAFTEMEKDDAVRIGLLYAQGANFTAGLQLDQFAPRMARGESAESGEFPPNSAR
jgi:enoyl-CoA hydratase/carnithine racemase